MGAEAEAAVPVRGTVKSMGSFTRVQLAAPIAAEVAQGDTTVTFRYGEPVTADLGALEARLAPLGATVRQSGPSAVTVSVPPGTRLRSFMGNGVAGLDITPGPRPAAPAPKPAAPTPAAPKQAAPQPAAPKPRPAASQPKAEAAKREAPPQPAAPEPATAKPPATPAAVTYEATPDFLVLVIEKQAPGKAVLRRTGNTLDIRAGEPVPPALPGLSDEAKAYVASITAPKYSGGYGVRLVLKKGALQPALSQNGQTVRLTLTPPGKIPPPPPAGKEAPASAAPEAAKAAEPPRQPEGTAVTAEGDALILTLPRVKGSGMAAYSRNGYLWIATSKPTPVKTDALRAPGTALIGEASIIPSAQGTILNFVERRPLQAVVGFDDGNWRIRIAPAVEAERRNIAILTDTGAGGQDVTKVTLVSEEGFTGPFALDDPLTGERLVFLPAAGEEAVREPRRMVEMALPATYQGAVAILTSEAVTWKIDGKQAVFQNTNGRFIGSPAPAAPPAPSASPGAPRPFDEGAESTPAVRRAYLARLLESKSPVEQAALRLQYLNALVRREDYPEALGFATYALQVNPEAARAAGADLTLGALHLYFGRYPQAAALFAADHRKDTPGAATLLALASVLDGQPDAAVDIKAADEALRTYPASLRARIWRDLIDHYLYTRKPAEAEAAIALLREPAIAEKLDPDWRKLIDAELLALKGQGQDAQPALRTLAGLVDDREVRARAAYRLVASQLERRQITRPEAAKTLESLRHTWREAYPEALILSLLGEQYLLEKNYRQALDTWRYLTAEYGAFPGRDDILRKMSDTFLYLFNDDGAKDMSPLDALTLYYEFRELTPTGPEGDVMIRNLADRLVGVELLERASALLTHQIRFRVKGEERARVAARLALIHLLNKQPKLAVEVLDYTGDDGLPEDLVLTRNRIKAQAYLDMEDFQSALEQLAEDPTPEGQQLRLEILWRMQNWADVIGILSFNLKDRETLDESLSPEEVQNLFRLALAYVYTGDSGGLENLRARFMPLLADETMRQQFDFLTRDDGTPDYTNMQAVTARIGQFENFMGTLQKKVQDEGLSKAVE